MKAADVNSYFSSYFNQESEKGDFLERQQMLRKAAKVRFLEQGMPDASCEAWRNFPWERILKNSYRICLNPQAYHPEEASFQCDNQEIHSTQFTFLNGWYLHDNAPLTRFPNGMIMGSLRAACRECPELVNPYFQSAVDDGDGWVHFNAALWQDGFFVYVPSRLQLRDPIQLVNWVKSDESLLIQMRNLIVVGEGASLKLVHCDESLKSEHSFVNSVTEICVGKQAHFDYYKLENKDNQAFLVNHLLIRQEAESEVNTHTSTFNGGVVSNSIRVLLEGERARVCNNGLYLADGKQYVSNDVFICHQAVGCVSNQLYKGILDDDAQSAFIGHVLVKPHAQATEAHQINRNILLKDTARITAKPFLEIYADDVQCTHGATVGQLDEQAVFYLRSRGICERNARLLLMHAYAKEVIDKMDIPAIADRTEGLVEKRLAGENITCTNCMAHCCSTPDFHIKAPDF
ncbi:MAG: Fe-S cluster assembly protein SufD [Bacteroidales bacterium]|nr:Fe-S cluster assembly protein SufD [Bacteroidales bacterium]